MFYTVGVEPYFWFHLGAIIAKLLLQLVEQLLKRWWILDHYSGSGNTTTQPFLEKDQKVNQFLRNLNLELKRTKTSRTN